MAPRRIKRFQNYENKGVNVVKMRDVKIIVKVCVDIGALWTMR